MFKSCPKRLKIVYKPLVILLLVTGSILVHIYLDAVRSSYPFDISLLFSGVFLWSAGMSLLLVPILLYDQRKVNNVFFMFSVLLLSFSIAFIKKTSYSVVLETDSFVEVACATITFSQHTWTPNFQPMYGYFGDLSVTILPAMISLLTGTKILDLFIFMEPTITGLMPLVFFVVIRRFFGDNVITYLSVGLTPQLWFFMGYTSAFRMLCALISMFLMLYCLQLKGMKGGFLRIIFAFGIVTAHYTVGYFTVLFYPLLLLSSIVPAKLTRRFQFNDVKHRKAITSHLVNYVVILLAWLVYTESIVFCSHLENIPRLLESLVSQLSTSSVEAGWVLNSPRGPIVTMWFDVQFALIGVGGLIEFFRYFGRKTSSIWEDRWILVGCAFLLFILLTALTPLSFKFLETERLIRYTLPFLMVFLARSLVAFKCKHLTVLPILFMLLMLPMNLMLPSHQNSFIFHADTQQEPERVLSWYSGRCRGKAYIVAARWIGEHVEYLPMAYKGGAVLVDSYSIGYMYLGLDIDRIEYWSLHPSRYIVFHDLFLQYGLWGFTRRQRTTAIWKHDQNIFLNDPKIDLVYNDHALTLAFLSSQF